MSRAGLYVVLAALALGGCFLDPAPIEGKACPCPLPEYRCNETTQVCEATGGCIPAAVSAGFRPLWATPNAIYWEWNPPENLRVVRSYRVVVGASEEEVDSETNVRVFGPQQNPELDQPQLRETEAGDPVRATFTDGLEPGTTYFAKLVTKDTFGCESSSVVLSEQTTAVGSESMKLFDGEGGGSFDTLPDIAQVGPCETGSRCLSYVEPTDPHGYENVRVKVGPFAAASFTQGDFDEAYLEMKIRTNSTVVATWSEIRIEVGGGLFFGRGYLAFRTDDELHTYQIPLHVLRGDSDPSPDNATDVALDLALFSLGVVEIGAGSTWSHGSHVYIDDVYVRW